MPPGQRIARGILQPARAAPQRKPVGARAEHPRGIDHHAPHGVVVGHGQRQEDVVGRVPPGIRPPCAELVVACVLCCRRVQRFVEPHGKAVHGGRGVFRRRKLGGPRPQCVGVPGRIGKGHRGGPGVDRPRPVHRVPARRAPIGRRIGQHLVHLLGAQARPLLEQQGGHPGCVRGRSAGAVEVGPRVLVAIIGTEERRIAAVRGGEVRLGTRLGRHQAVVASGEVNRGRAAAAGRLDLPGRIAGVGRSPHRRGPLGCRVPGDRAAVGLLRILAKAQLPLWRPQFQVRRLGARHMVDLKVVRPRRKHHGFQRCTQGRIIVQRGGHQVARLVEGVQIEIAHALAGGVPRLVPLQHQPRLREDLHAQRYIHGRPGIEVVEVLARGVIDGGIPLGGLAVAKDRLVGVIRGIARRGKIGHPMRVDHVVDGLGDGAIGQGRLGPIACPVDDDVAAGLGQLVDRPGEVQLTPRHAPKHQFRAGGHVVDDFEHRPALIARPAGRAIPQHHHACRQVAAGLAGGQSAACAIDGIGKHPDPHPRPGVAGQLANPIGPHRCVALGDDQARRFAQGGRLERPALG